jgi:putative photosynthetic complex assembly protein
MMSQPFDNRPFPRGPLIGAAALIALSLAAAGSARLMRSHTPTLPTAVIATRDLRFVDRPDHAVAVYDIRDDRPIAVVPPGTNGFLRAALRGLARDRRRDGGGSEAPFRLTAHGDGRLTLQDLVTGDRVELEAFGAANETVFARLLTETEATQ